ncbi:MAG: CadC family transcriptional regulator [Acidobacteria bacterium OLB17]|nr:MAG: CadC family transcriptional regulator [Acidobacteria bacterium OLB17]MCZ2390179.1 winged helix-turn-helix domain-containing protein [Acidobacteriota bacterium]
MPEIYKFGDFELDPEDETLANDGQVAAINRRAFQVLLLLVERSGEIVSKDDFFNSIWQNAFVEEGNLTVAIATLRRVLNDDPRQPKFIQNLPRRGYRFIAPVSRVPKEQPAVADDGPSENVAAEPVDLAAPPHTADIETPTNSPLPWRKLIPIGIGAAVLLAVLSAAATYFRSPVESNAKPAPATPLIRSIAVLPVDFANDENEYIAEAFADRLTRELSKIPDLRVVSQRSTQAFKGKTDDKAAIAQKLNVEAVITGRIEGASNNLTAGFELTDLRSGNVAWSNRRAFSPDILLTCHKLLASELATALRPGFEPTAASIGTTDREAYLLYLKGKYYYERRQELTSSNTYDKAVEYFKQAIDKDPTFPLPYVGMAKAYAQASVGSNIVPRSVPERYQIVGAYIQKALQIDPNLSEAVAARGLNEFFIAQMPQWEQARQDYERAIELDPNNAQARHWYAEYLALVGRFDESFAEYDRAIALDPLSMAVRGDKCFAYMFASQFDQAAGCIEDVQRADPAFQRTYYWAASIYLSMHRYKDATDSFNKAIVGSAEDAEAAGYHKILSDAANTNDDRTFWRAFARVAEMRKNKFEVAYSYAQLGEADKAFEILEAKIGNWEGTNPFHLADPKYSPLYGDPRWAELRRKLGRPE